jgi:CheY-like chemotaxis protein
MTREASVLVVDDDPSIRDFVEAALEEEGYGVLTAPDGEAALALVESKPCAVLLDMRMPVLDGWGFAEAYRERPEPRAPIVVMTAAEDAEAWAEEIGAAGVLAKPFRLDELLAVVAHHCRG